MKTLSPALDFPLRIYTDDLGMAKAIHDAKGRQLDNLTGASFQVGVGEFGKIELYFQGALEVSTDPVPDPSNLPKITDQELEAIAKRRGYLLVPDDRDETEVVPLEQDLKADANPAD